ncbi:hypothetical protein C0Q70_05753 [Pomacea canaliculata]|uniref:Cyclic nucleotide-binding domain-containing protein n=2 Tax=Pomacea canaliculata TaxID=400727 RepID=A0A2T7PM27_POMCA|nr:hypothetical protein C0Q70_05753 [Pomacea canaliculata]
MLKRALSLTTKHRLKSMIGEAVRLTRGNTTETRDFTDVQAARLLCLDRTYIQDTEPASRFRRMSRVVLLLIKVCNICKDTLRRGLRKEPWYALIDTTVATSNLQKRRKGPRAFVTFVPNDAKELIQLTFDAADFSRDHRTEFILTDKLREMMSIVPGQRRPEQIAEILRCLKTLSTDFASYTLSTQKQICQRAFYDKYRFNRVILKQGHPADGIYFVLSGQLIEKHESKKHPKELHAGEKFGETDLLCCRRRRYTVVTKTNTELLYLHRQDYKVIFDMADDANNLKHLEICKQHAVFQHFPMQRLVETPGVWSVVKYKFGQLIARDANNVDWIYVIKSGEARVLKYLDPCHIDVQARRRKIQAFLNSQSPFYRKKRLYDFIQDRDYIKSSYKPAIYHPQVVNRALVKSAPPSTSRCHVTSSKTRILQSSVSLPVTKQGLRQAFITRPSTEARQGRPIRQELSLPKLVIDAVPACEEVVTGSEFVDKIHADVEEDMMVQERVEQLSVPSASPLEGSLIVPRRDLSEERPERPDQSITDSTGCGDDVSFGQLTHDNVRNDSRDHNQVVKQFLEKNVVPDVAGDHCRKTDPVHDGKTQSPEGGTGTSPMARGRSSSFPNTPLSGVAAPIRSLSGRKIDSPSQVIQVGSHTLPAFVQIETLYPGQVFGLRACLDPEERGPTVSLVSGECEVLQINRKFFMRHCDDAIYGLIRLKHKPFPSEEDLIDRLDVNMRWEEYKQRTLSSILPQSRPVHSTSRLRHPNRHEYSRY